MKSLPYRFSLLFLLMLPLILWNCSGRDLIKEEREFVAEHIEDNPLLQHHTLTVGQHRLHYAMRGDRHKPALIIIHGTPGDWRQYARYLLNDEMLEHFLMITIDRPGWGQSVLAGGQEIASFEEQAKIIAELAKKLRQDSNNQPVILMGHSLGASLAPRVAMDFPELIDGLLLFAGTIDPNLSSPRWFNYLGRVPLVNYVIGERLHRSNKEIFALKDNMRAMDNRWHEITAKVIAVQGTKDGLVYPANSAYIEKTFNPETTTVIRLQKTGHLFPMTMRRQVVDWAKQLLKNIQEGVSATLVNS